MADAALLLDNDTQVIYASSKAAQIMSRLHIPYALGAKFFLSDPYHVERFAAFIKHKENKSLVLLLTGKQEHDELLLSCFRLPEPVTPHLHVAKYLITLRNPHYYPITQWQVFTMQFSLTIAEARLCLDLADGLSLSDYSKKWHVTIGTARSQLHNIFAKTNTKRQSDLLRLMYLFIRS
jgi:DNA-binding CsgD family transcriptional regulator